VGDGDGDPNRFASDNGDGDSNADVIARTCEQLEPMSPPLTCLINKDVVRLNSCTLERDWATLPISQMKVSVLWIPRPKPT